MASKIRIITGLILFVFATSHLLNLAMGLYSLEQMDAWRKIIMTPWKSAIGRAILLFSLVSHGVLGLSALYHRNTLHMSATDGVQFVSGLLILPLLVPHIVSLRLAAELVPNYEPSYRLLLHYFWIADPLEGLRQIVTLVVVWIHGAIGLLTWFRLQSWWPRFGPWINPVMMVIPVSALLGFVEAGNYVIATSTMPFVPSPPGPVVQNALDMIYIVKWSIILVYVLMLVGTLVARALRLRSWDQLVHVSYVDGPQITAKTGVNLLELAIANNIPHANLCRGRGRCGTCRVKIISSEHPLPVASDLELAVLEKVNAGPDVRLACQLKLHGGTLNVERVVATYVAPRDLVEVSGPEPQARPAVEAPEAGASG